MKKTDYFILILLAGFFAACSKMKTEEPFQFPVDNTAPEPPRTVDIDPDTTMAFKLHYHDSTYNTQMKGVIRNVFAAEPPVFTLQAKLNNDEQLAIRLHFDDAGNIPSGKYIIRNNQVMTGPITPHSMELLGYQGPLGQIYGGFNQELRSPENNDTAQFYYTLVMEIDSMNREQHLITGFIDTLMVADKSDTSRKVLITGGEFALYYNFFEISINGVPEAPAGQWNGDPTTQNSGGGWADFWQFNFDDGRQFTYGWDPTVWTEENVNQFNAARGKGVYKIPYPGALYWAISYADIAGTYSFSCSDTLTIQLDNFNTNQFAKGKLFFKAREIDMNTYTSFIPGGPEINVEIAFAYRELL